VKILYTATGTATDEGRSGRARTDDGRLDVELSLPEALGGAGGDGTNPEQLFAVGWSACFANAMRSAARRRGTEDDVDGSTVAAHVGIGPVGGGTFALQAKLEVSVPKLDQAGAEELVALAHERCPYSRATRGNIEVELSVRGGS
jgi:lipoyl-dependent peroxiredoxin